MILSFELSMPNVGSWNGKWTGQGNLYARTRRYMGKDEIKHAKKILEAGPFFYNFGDGWTARITVRKVDSNASRKINRRTRGFYGYDWMIDSIDKHLEIRK
jgi:hypothetical protein